MGAVAYWSRRAARLHSSIRGLSPQAGGFRRRSNRASSVCRATGIAHDPYERLPCVQQVVTSHLLFRIILQYAAVFQPRVLFLFRGTRNILPTDLSTRRVVVQTAALDLNFGIHAKFSCPALPVLVVFRVRSRREDASLPCPLSMRRRTARGSEGRLRSNGVAARKGPCGFSVFSGKIPDCDFL